MLDSRKMISVLIPVYNGEATIGRCLDSILRQTYHHFEIIVINDGSTDHTMDVLKGYPTVKVYSNYRNQGVGYTRNKLIQKCQTPYFIFVDSDDMLYDDALEIMYQKIVHEKADMVMGRLDDKKHEEVILTNSNKFDFIFKNIDDFYMINANKLYRKSVFHHLSYPTVNFADDEYMLVKIIANVKKLVVLKEKTYYYDRKTLGIHSTSLQYYQDCINAYQERYQYFQSTKYEKDACYMLKNIMIYYYKQFYKFHLKKEQKEVGYLFRKTVKQNLKYTRIRDVFFYFFPKWYCILRNNIGDEE